MSNIKSFLEDISNMDLSFAELKSNEENENDRAYPYILQSSAKITSIILEKYHNWLVENYDIIPKKK